MIYYFSSEVYIDGIVYHSNTSTSEGVNTSITIYWPVYMTPQYTFVTENNKTCSLSQSQDTADVVEIYVSTNLKI